MRTKIKLIRRFKYLFYRFGIHRLIPGRSLNFLGHLAAISKWISKNRKVQFSNFPTSNFIYDDRYKLYQFIIDNEIAGAPADYLEFGVAQGKSFTWWMDHVKHEDARFYG